MSIGALTIGAASALMLGNSTAAAATPLVRPAVIGVAPTVPDGAVPRAVPLPSLMDVSVALTPSDPAGLQAYATSTSTPGSVSYRKFLTPAEVQARFGPSPSVVEQIRRWLASTGLTLRPTSGDGTVIPVTGTAGQVASTFQTSLHNYQLPSGRIAYANTTPPQVPAQLASSVQGVIGLDDLSLDHTDGATGSVSPGAAGRARPAVAGSGPKPCAAATLAAAALTGAPRPCLAPGSGATADQIAAGFGYSPLYAAGDLGQGTTVAVIMGGADYSDGDIGSFEQCFGIHTPVSRVPIDGGTTGVDGDGPEITMDIETVASLAPNTSILAYEAPALSTQGTLDAFAAVVQDNKADAVTASFGSCEGLGTDLIAENTIFEEMAVQGQTMFASTGDEGSEACLPQTGFVLTPAAGTALAVNDPASQPFVTAVGGAYLSNLAAPSSANVSVWNIGPFNFWLGNEVASGGASGFWTMSPWQVGQDPNQGTDNPGDCGTFGALPCREVPDVSGNADVRNGEVIYCTLPSCVASENQGGPDPAPGWFAGGGTSYASPQWAALAALIDEGVTGGRLGLLTPMLYQVAATNPSAFTDVAQGNNNYLTAGNTYISQGGTANYTCSYGGSPHTSPCYQATVGYDMASGLGVPLGNVLAAAVRALAVSPFSVSSTSLPGGVVGASYSASLQGAGGVAPYSWSITQGSLPAGLSLDPTGMITGTPTAVGTDNFVVSAADSSVGVPRTDSAVLSIAVGPAAAPFYGSEGGSRLNAPIVGMAASPGGRGYWLVASDGGIFSFGDAPFYGSQGGSHLNKPIVGMAASPGGRGYWLVASDGGIFSFGDAPFYGSEGGSRLNAPIVGMAASPSGHGYWLAASDGGTFSFGDALFYGSEGGSRLNAPIVGMAAGPSGRGYWLVASDGGIFSFGDAPFYGSEGGSRLNAPIVGMAASPSGHGYWLAASDGGTFSFGDALFYGSEGGSRLNAPIVGMAAGPSGRGYWLVASDGGIFSFGDAQFYGSEGGSRLNAPVVGMAADAGNARQNGGYRMVASDGGIFSFGGASFLGSQGGMHLNMPIVGIADINGGNGYWSVASDGGVFGSGP